MPLIRTGVRMSGMGEPEPASCCALRDGGEPCVCDLAWICERPDELVSHHVRSLRSAGLVRSRRHRRMVLCELTPAGEALLAELVPAGRGARR